MSSGLWFASTPRVSWVATCAVNDEIAALVATAATEVAKAGGLSDDELKAEAPAIAPLPTLPELQDPKLIEAQKAKAAAEVKLKAEAEKKHLKVMRN